MRSNGFTLLELSIVLVIIGLVTGGVLAGRELIEAAQIRRQITEIEDIQKATATFKLKYNCLPGDCAQATAIWGTTDHNGKTVLNGDGDAIIKSTVNDGTYCGSGYVASSELTQFFLHLYNAELWNFASDGAGYFVGVGFPELAYHNRSGLMVTCTEIAGNPYNDHIFSPPLSMGKNAIILGARTFDRVDFSLGLNSWSENWGDGSNRGMPVEAVRSIDTKIDDGLPISGSFGVLQTRGGGGAWWNLGCGGNGLSTNTYSTFEEKCPTLAAKLLGL